MAAKKPFTFTSISYVINKSGDGSVRRRCETVFEQIPSSKGTYEYKPIKRTVYMSKNERLTCDRKMMENVGTTLSDYLSNNSE